MFTEFCLVKPNISPLIMEQISQETLKVKTDKEGRRVIVDPAVTATRIYNYFYMLVQAAKKSLMNCLLT
jgi:hypothetical protein